ncbi:hypothetical protein GGR56DRAFT_619132 [Xylariaceae sp. FL0804]|nr:hypothetical protein GGR56DRAFT_619132 [Xylariaceae sp. FL0804]
MVTAAAAAAAVQNLGSALYQAFITLPWNVLTTPRQHPDLPHYHHHQPNMEGNNYNNNSSTDGHNRDDDAAESSSSYRIGDRLYELCRREEASVTALVAADGGKKPAAEAWKTLFGKPHHGGDRDIRDIGRGRLSAEERLRAKSAGNWGPTEPSELFLRIFHDALCTLDDDPEPGVVSPSLMGTCGTMPLTVLSVIPDIVRHMSNLIVRAEREVFLATNFWQNSVASAYLVNGLRELSRRAGARGGPRVVVKVLYDRGSLKQLFEPHSNVAEKEWTGAAVGLPPAHEIPHVDLQVMNYHHPVLGTFHSKFMVVDRRIGLIQSNNIQDNDNMEMMVQVEGPIVDALYDMALISWSSAMQPPLPCLDSSATAATARGEAGSFLPSHAALFTPEGTLVGHGAVIDPKKLPKRQAYGRELPGVTTSDTETSQSNIAPAADGMARQPADLETAPDRLPEHTKDDPHYDDDIAGEVLRVQASVSAKHGETAMQAITRHLNHTVNKGFEGDAPPCAPADEMTPYIPHPAHKPVPMALINRKPHGPPNHKSVANPQNAAWLSALRNAKKNVFIQSPTVNAEPLIPAIVEACERGIDVWCYVCLGYNDAGELLPMQGGHNEGVSHRLHAALSEAARPRLHWHWYVGKDQTRPLSSGSPPKRRSCHVKLMIVDEAVGIVGSGNQDTQSWFHSQEVNVLVDAPDVCACWVDALRRNQNTGARGAVDNADGVWRDHEGDGKEAPGAMGVDAGKFGWATGLVGAVKRVKGTGGF